MAADALNLRSALSGGCALVAGLLWVAALLGLGSGIGAPAGDTASLPALPALPAALPSPMESPSSYAAVTAQPVFAEDRQPHPFRLQAQAGNEGGTLRLTGVLMSDAFGMATLSNAQNRSIRLRLNGDTVDGWQLLALEPRRATVLGPDGAQVLELAVFDGQGGEPPTQLAAPSGTPPPATGRVLPPPAPPAPGVAEQRGDAARTAQRPAGTADAAPAGNGPTEEQMAAIRERIRARRAQLQQQQQQQQQQSPPAGGAANR